MNHTDSFMLSLALVRARLCSLVVFLTNKGGYTTTRAALVWYNYSNTVLSHLLDIDEKKWKRHNLDKEVVGELWVLMCVHFNRATAILVNEDLNGKFLLISCILSTDRRYALWSRFHNQSRGVHRQEQLSHYLYVDFISF